MSRSISSRLARRSRVSIQIFVLRFEIFTSRSSRSLSMRFSCAICSASESVGAGGIVAVSDCYMRRRIPKSSRRSASIAVNSRSANTGLRPILSNLTNQSAKKLPLSSVVVGVTTSAVDSSGAGCCEYAQHLPNLG